MRVYGNAVLTTLIIVMVSAFLFGARLEARWAGGLGKIPACPAKLVNSQLEYKRGDILTTSTNDFAQYTLCDGTQIFLDVNTQIRLVAYPVNTIPTQLELIQGRVFIHGQADIKARNLNAQIKDSACEFVHYSWLDIFDITPQLGAGCTVQAPAQHTPTVRQTTSYNTYTAEVLLVKPFVPTDSSARAFFEWIGL